MSTSTTATSTHDLVILGGGLAGLTLALQLRDRMPDLDVLVLERRAHPVPEACHKVGESCVEIAADYFEHVLGLGEHLRTRQLRKFGFRFFWSEGRRDIENVTELGGGRILPTGSWQLDRGIFENFLAEEAQARGARFVDNATIRRVTLAAANSGTDHVVTWQRSGEAEQDVRARWVVDASGRAGLLKRQLGLARDNDHGVHAVWFRIGTRLAIDGWSDSPAWQRRVATPSRWLSTNHLCGAGYWVWMIPLSSGSHSIGIVADPRIHPLETMNTFERAMDWLRRFQPALWDAIDGQRDKLQDFAFFRRFSYDCSQIFSADRWALTGEAGRFLDPFYSPGSDFIAIGNTYITELVARDRAGQRIAAHVQVYEQIFRSFYDGTLTLYQDQYALFGDAEVMPVKVLWDYAYYWGVMAQLFVQRRLADLGSLARLRDEMFTSWRLNSAVQDFFRAWGKVSERRNDARMLDQAELPWFAELNRSLGDRLDDAAFCASIRRATRMLQALAREICEAAPQVDGTAVRALLPADAGAGFEPMLFAPTDRTAVAA